MNCLALLCCLAALNPAANVQAPEPGVTLVYDFIDRFPRAEVIDASQCSASQREKVGDVAMQGLFLHPGGSDDAIVRYDDVAVPGDSAFLLFNLGIRDGFDWNDPRKPDGVRFGVSIDGDTVFTEDVADPGWRMRVVDLSPWAGKTVRVGFHTNARANSNYDWAVFGRPALVYVRPAPLEGVDKQRNGLALAHVNAETEAVVSLNVGDTTTTVSLTPGEHWIAVAYDRPAAASLEVVSGQATLSDVRYAPFAPKIDVLRFELSTPYVESLKAFNIVLQVANNGWGAVSERSQMLFMNFEVSKTPGGANQGKIAVPRFVPPLNPGERGWVIWDDVEVQSPGYARFSLDDGQVLSFRVHAPAGPTGEINPDAVGAVLLGEKGCAAVTTPRGRVVVDIRDDGHAWLDVRNGDAFQRVGMLYPLARLAVEGGSPYDAVTFNHLELVEGGLRLVSDVGVVVNFTPDVATGQIVTEVAYTPAADVEVRALYGPRILAGQGAYGIHKDFAIFPGLEYLEAREGSSAERDLVFPLSERQVPAPYKIAAPLMAVQGQDSLIALLWNPKQEWTAGMPYPAARFNSPAPETGYQQTTMALFAPSVGGYVAENSYEAETPYSLAAGETMRVRYQLVLDHASNYGAESVVHGGHEGGLVLQAFQHYFAAYGFTEPSDPPRDWEATKALSRQAYTGAIWQEEPPGWRHCAGWAGGLNLGHAVPQSLLIRDGAAPEDSATLQSHIDAVIGRALEGQGPGALASRAGCHIVAGELPFYYGYVPEALSAMADAARGLPDQREEGLWVWRPQGGKYADLGIPGDHTLGQAAMPSFTMLRAARLSGDRDLTEAALAAMQQMSRYNVPRGAQMWECPLYQPDILAAAYAIRAYCEAYRLTGDPSHLANARYWAWSGLPFLYLWDLPGYPTMRYNVISVIGSTFYTHSWIGLPVVWCGLVYAYALQDFAQYDDSLDWRAMATGITRSAEWQQYTDGPNRGTYPDSWNMVKNRPNPADISPENILMNGFRLHGPSPAIDAERFNTTEGAVMLNSAAEIGAYQGMPGEGTLSFKLKGPAGFPLYSMLAPVAAPAEVSGVTTPAESSASLRESAEGWRYDPGLQAVVVKTLMSGKSDEVTITW